MLRRLLFSLLIACLAVPAVAAPVSHQPQPNVAMHHGGHGKAKHGAPAADHQCIGCIAPFALSAPVADPLLSPSVAPPPFRVAQVASAPSGPEPPPPRA